jgi:hypothetical protein
MVHGDVRRMLLTCKAFAEGARSMMYETSLLSDYMLVAKTPEEHAKVDDEMGFLTPILKGYCRLCPSAPMRSRMRWLIRLGH